MRIKRDGVILILSSLILTFVFLSTKESAFVKAEKFVPFEESMTKYDPAFTSKILTKKLSKDLRWKKLKEAYVTHILKGKSNTSYRIPKIIHQIWLGGPLPEKYKEIQKTWQKYHPDWQYYLWTDKEVRTLFLKNPVLYENTTHLGEKSEILRYEILYQFGGLYVDTDFECLRPFDILNQLCDFYIGLENIEKNVKAPRCANHLIGCVPNHPIIKECLKILNGDGHMTDCDPIPYYTGPTLISHLFFHSLDDPKYRNVALPASFFYPLPLRKCDGSLGGAIKEKWIQDESFAIHYWDNSLSPQKSEAHINTKCTQNE